MRRNHIADEIIPAWAATAGGLLLVAVLTLTTLAVITGDATPPAPGGAAPVLSSREVAFEERLDGHLVVRDAASGDQIVRLSEDDGGFILGVLRVMNRERRQHDLDLGLPYRVSAHANGRLALTDLSTGRVIDINAFGTTQAEAFAALL